MEFSSRFAHFLGLFFSSRVPIKIHQGLLTYLGDLDQKTNCTTLSIRTIYFNFNFPTLKNQVFSLEALVEAIKIFRYSITLSYIISISHLALFYLAQGENIAPGNAFFGKMMACHS